MSTARGECPDTPEELYLASELSFTWGSGEKRKSIRHNDPVFVMGVDRSYLGIGRFLGSASRKFMGEPDFMPILEVQGHQLFGYECWWGHAAELEGSEELPITPIGEYLAKEEAALAMVDAADKIAQEGMGISFDEDTI